MTKKLFLTVILSIMLVFTMMPLQQGISYAAGPVQAPGGTAASDDPDAFLAALGSGNVSAVSEESGGRTVTTITLGRDLLLNGPLQISQGSAADMVVIELNGHAICGRDGTESESLEGSQGVSPIEITAADFDVVINGPGWVSGGKGALFQTPEQFRSGADGGDAVSFANSSYYPSADNARLDYGLTVAGGAVLTGGDGGDVSSADWLYNIENYTADRFSPPRFVAGSGGSGIGQYNSGVLFDSSSPSFVYTQINVEDGTVTGGKGGIVDMTGFTPTQYALMTSSAAKAVMSGRENREYNSQVLSLSSLNAGRGGDGIRTGGGRKYINIGENARVSGNSCGTVDFGENRTINQLATGFSYGSCYRTNQFNAGDAGNGIAVWPGDLGLTRLDPDRSEEDLQTVTRDSDDMGIFVAGQVFGGSCPDADALYENGGEGGAGIALYGDFDRFGSDDAVNGETHLKWGIVDIKGTVTGGNGGSSAAGMGGAGGNGIHEDYFVDYGDRGTDYYIVNGTVKGGSGGSTLSSPTLFGSGGSGMSFSDSSRHDLTVTGSGTAVAGDCGKAVERPDAEADGPLPNAIYLNPLVSEEYAAETYHNNVTIGRKKGAGSEKLPADQIKVTASMSKFSSCPAASTQLTCSFRKPAGYTGEAYAEWFIQLSILDETRLIEPSGTDGLNLHFLSDKDYGYLSYETASYWNQYNLDVATVDRIKEVFQNNGAKARIWCEILLEDGSWGRSNVMEFTSKGWAGGSGTTDPDPVPTTDDEEAAAVVADQIGLLPDIFDVTLEDAEAVAAARAAYDSLTDLQKTLIRKADLTKLENLEHQIQELQQAADQAAAAAAEGVIAEQMDALEALPKDLSQLDPDDPEDEASIVAARSALETAIAAYNDLTDTQKQIVSADLLAALNEAAAAFDESLSGGSPLPALIIALTADMITADSATYTGKALQPPVTVTAFGKELLEGSDYTVTYADNVNAGTGTAIVTGKYRYCGSVKAAFTIAKAANPMAVKGRTCKVKYKTAKKKNQTLSRSKVLTVSKSQGKVTYKKASGNKKITISKVGKVTVKKKIKKGTYKIKVKVTATGNGNYKALTRTVSFKIRVR